MDKSPEVRQAACYGLGVLGQFGGEQYAQSCAEGIPRLVQVISDPNSRDDENINATENAISAVTKILKYNNYSLNVEEILPVWFSWLPVWEDTDEAPHVYGFLCDLIEANNPTILGPHNTNLPKIFSVIAMAYSKEAFEKESHISNRILALVNHIRSGMRPIFDYCIKYLTEEQKEIIYSLLLQNGNQVTE